MLDAKKSPCKDCPYRTDAPLQLWAKEEFEDLLESETDMIGKTYGCHKKDDNLCTGWVIKQVENDLPSIAFRLHLSKNKIKFEELEALSSPVPLYPTVISMCKANYPEVFKDE